jgi:transposase-like protein
MPAYRQAERSSILMEKRKWSSQEKLRIVLEGLSGQIEISKLCSKYQIAQTQYYQWRDLLLKHGNQAFETKNQTKKEQHLQEEVQKLRRIIGDLTVELKKSEYEL